MNEVSRRPSHQAVARLRTMYDAFNRGDREEAVSVCHPDIVLIQPAELPGGTGTYRGHTGLALALSELLEAWDDYTMEPERIEALADDQLVAAVRLRGRGHASGLGMESRFGHLITMHDGLVVRWEVFRTPQEAVEAARVS